MHWMQVRASFGCGMTISVVWPYAYKWLWYACRSPLSVSLPHSCSHFFFPLLTLSLSPSLTHSLTPSLSFFLPLSPSPLFFLTLIKKERTVTIHVFCHSNSTLSYSLKILCLSLLLKIATYIPLSITADIASPLSSNVAFIVPHHASWLVPLIMPWGCCWSLCLFVCVSYWLQ